MECKRQKSLGNKKDPQTNSGSRVLGVYTYFYVSVFDLLYFSPVLTMREPILLSKIYDLIIYAFSSFFHITQEMSMQITKKITILERF